MKVTMSHHCGSHSNISSAQATLRHSFNNSFRAKEEHIDKSLSAQNIVLHREDLKAAYEMEFGKAVKDYNQQQIEKGHAERQISDYMQKVSEDKQKKVLYEHIIQLGNRNDIGINKYSENIEVFKDFVHGWNERNPNMHLVGAVVHRDEREGSDHMHLFYFPVARDMERGLEVQNGLKQALKQMGVETRAKMGTAQTQWQTTEREALERISKEHGFEIEHIHGDRQHFEQQIFKTYMECEQAQTRLEAAREAEKELDKSLDIKHAELDELSQKPYKLPSTKKILGKEYYPADAVQDTLQQAHMKALEADKRTKVVEHERDTYKAALGQTEQEKDRLVDRLHDIQERQFDKGYLKQQLLEVQRAEREQMPEHTRNHDREMSISGR